MSAPAVITWTAEQNEEFCTWLHAPLTVAELLRIELAAAARQYELLIADELLADIDEEAMWRDIANQAALRDLAEAAPNPLPDDEPNTVAALPPITALIRAS